MYMFGLGEKELLHVYINLYTLSNQEHPLNTETFNSLLSSCILWQVANLAVTYPSLRKFIVNVYLYLK